MVAAPDTRVFIGPDMQQEFLNDLLVTPTGGSQERLADALANGGGGAPAILLEDELTGEKISAMPDADAFDGTELLPLVQAGINVKGLLSAIAQFVLQPPSTATMLIETISGNNPPQISILAGNKTGGALGNGGAVRVAAGNNTATGPGGTLYLAAGDSVDNVGGDTFFLAGSSSGSGEGGQVSFQAGNSNGAKGGTINLIAGNNNINNDGGDIILTGGSGDNHAGNITLQVFADGKIIIPILPTSDPAVAGALWNDTGTLKISAG